MTDLFLDWALLPAGWARDVRITVDQGRFVSVIPDTRPEPGDDRHALALPGLANLHSHAFQRGMAGLSEIRGPAADDFWTWRQVMYRFLARMTPDDVAAITAKAFAEMLESGFTRVGEFHYLHNTPDGGAYADPAELSVRIAAAAAETGIGLTLLPVFYAHGDFGGAPPDPGQGRFLTGLDGFARLLDRGRTIVAAQDGATIGIAPHSLRAVSPTELTALLGLAPHGPIHMHIAEQEREVAACQAWSGARPVTWLLDHAAIDTRWCLIHATHMTRDETIRLAGTGAVAGLCPITEANLGDGVFNGPDWTTAGGVYGVGTDSNVQIDAGAELRHLEYAQRLIRRGRNLMAAGEGVSTGGTLFRNALHGGWAALGLNRAPTGLAPGAPAELVTLNPDLLPGEPPSQTRREATEADGGQRRSALTADTALDRWIFGTGRLAIDTVWVRGVRRVQAGRHHDHDRIAARFRACLRTLLA